MFRVFLGGVEMEFNMGCLPSHGVVNFWDKDNKQRLKGFQALSRPIPCAAFHAQGNLFAYASSCCDWSRGGQHHQPGTPNQIFIHYTPDDEIRPKAKKRETITL